MSQSFRSSISKTPMSDRTREDALRSALERLPVAVVAVEGARILVPYNQPAIAFFNREAIRGDLINTRPTHPLSVLIQRILNSTSHGTSDEALIRMPGGNRYHIERSRRSDKGAGRMLLLLIKPWTASTGAPAELDEWNLTDREQDVARLMLEGSGTREIATRLEISSNTLRTHIRRILAKTFTKTRAEFVSKVMRSK